MCYVVKAHCHLQRIDPDGFFVDSIDEGRGYMTKIISVDRTFEDAYKAMEEYFDPSLCLELYSSDEIVDHYYGKRRIEYDTNGLRVLVTLAIQRKKRIPKGWAV